MPTAAQWQLLITELALPAYNGTNPAQAATLILAKSPVSVAVPAISKSSMLEVIVPSDMLALTPTEINQFNAVANMDPLGPNAIAILVLIFAGHTTTISNLNALKTGSIPWIISIGFTEFGPGHVAQARNMVVT